MAVRLKAGAKGKDVKALQDTLNQFGYGLAVDGIFGDKTLSALTDYQGRTGLTAEQLVESRTWADGPTNSPTGGSTGTLPPADTTGATGSTGGDGTTVPGGSSSSLSITGTTDNPSYPYEELLKAIRDAQTNYTPLTEEQIREQAKNQYDPIFNQTRQSAEQAAEKARLALEQQLKELQPAFDRQRESTKEAFGDAYAQADRQALGRGMQRSSFNNQTLANIDTQGAKAQDEIGAAQTQAEGAIQGNITMNQEQLASTIQQLETDYTKSVSAYEDALRDRDYERATSQAQYIKQMEMALYELGLQQQQLALSQSQWEQQFREQQRQFELQLELQRQQMEQNKKSSGGGSSGGTTQQTQQPRSNVDDLLSALGGANASRVSTQSPVYIPPSGQKAYSDAIKKALEAAKKKKQPSAAARRTIPSVMAQ